MLFPIVQKLRGADYGTFCGPKTDFCIEGYQSSANSFIYNVFRLLRPDLNIAHHTHSVANVRRALSREILTLILFRDPSDAVPSMVARFRPSLEAGVYRYVRFYRFALSHSNQLILTSFEEVTERFERTVRRVQKETGFSFGEFDPDDVRRKTFEHIREWSSQNRTTGQMSLPRDERERKKAALRRGLSDVPRFEEAKALYRKMLTAEAASTETIP